MYVRLLSSQMVAIDGKSTMCHPGDWVDVGRQTALAWVAAGQAEIPAGKGGTFVPPGSGVLILGRLIPTWHQTILADLETREGDAPDVPFPNTLIWTPALCDLRPEFLPVGFSLLETWDMAVPLLSNELLAIDVPTTARDRKLTEKAILDLRTPVYNVGLMFVRQGGAGQETVQAYNQERGAYSKGDPGLAFLRALWTVKPRVNALPDTWSRKAASQIKRKRP